jgi:predicted nuclease of predicted toxin-antitoxin system
VRVLFDQGTPAPLRDALAHHTVVTAQERGWSTLKNGELLDAAERENFDVFVTTDSNLAYQQNLTARKIAIVVLTSSSWLRIRRTLSSVSRAVDRANPGQVSKSISPEQSKRQPTDFQTIAR